MTTTLSLTLGCYLATHFNVLVFAMLHLGAVFVQGFIKPAGKVALLLDGIQAQLATRPNAVTVFPRRLTGCRVGTSPRLLTDM